MKGSHLTGRIAALGLFASFFALHGCGGSGGGSSPSSPAAVSAAAFKNANLSGSFDTPDKSHARSSVPTVVTVQFANDNTSGTGVASFVSGSSSDPSTFAAYAADISNLNYTITSSTPSALTGTVTFDLNHFTNNKYFTDTTHFSGTYTVTAKNISTLTITGGSFTGKDPSGGATTATVPTFTVVGGMANLDLSGTYSGSASYLGVSLFSFTGATLAKVSGDGLHLNGTIPFTPPGSTTSTSLTFNGAYTHSSLSGAAVLPADITFTAPIVGVVTIPKGSTAQVYLTTNDGAKTITGSLLVNTSVLGNVVLNLTGTKSSTSTGGGGGGTTSSKFATGYYDGGIKGANGSLTDQIMKLNVIKVSSTAGANGAMIIKTGSVTEGPNIGARIATITGSGSNFTLTADNFTSTYSKMVITGTTDGSSLTATYTGTLLDGTTVTGSFDELGKVTLSNAAPSGTFRGTLTAMGTSNTTGFTGTFTTNASTGTVTVSTTSTYQGITLPPVTGYVAGTSIALKDSSEGTTLPSPFTGDVLYGNFDGEVTGTSIAGKYVLFANTASGTSVFAEYGTLALTKQ